jgi:hypothetical protein
MAIMSLPHFWRVIFKTQMSASSKKGSQFGTRENKNKQTMKVISGLLLFPFLKGARVSGMNASPFAFEEYQPDGGSITVKLHGDKDTSTLTDLNGTCIRIHRT